MSKRLILLLALVFVAGIAVAAYAEVQNVKISGDLTFLGIARNQFALKKNANLKNESATASIARVKIDADLTDNVSATVRLLNERYWGLESEDTASTEINIDLAYVTLKEFLYSPLTLMVGRQELHFGNEMVVGDVDTNRLVNTASAFTGHDEDLSARKAFDAIRATLDYHPLVIDVVAAKITEKVINNADDRNLYGVNAKYDTGVKNTTVEGYWFTKDSAKKYDVAGVANQDSKRDKIHTVGALIKSQPIENLTTSLEGAYQFGTFFDDYGVASGNPAATNNAAKRRAFALEAGANYRFAKVKYSPSLTLLGAWFSGAKNPSIAGNESRKTYTGWDPMFENQKYGDMANAQFGQSNARLVGGMASVKPMDDITLQGEYYAYWWDKKFVDNSTIPGNIVGKGGIANVRSYSYTMRNKRFAGQEIDLKAIYDYTEDVQFSLLAGWFLPGNSFNNTGNATGNSNMASELIGSMKVTF